LQSPRGKKQRKFHLARKDAAQTREATSIIAMTVINKRTAFECLISQTRYVLLISLAAFGGVDEPNTKHRAASRRRHNLRQHI
jgi:hypothetical protein